MSLDALVSMNFWGFMPDFFNQLDKDLKVFLEEESSELKSEFFLPAA